MTTFEQLDLHPQVQKAVAKLGFTTPSPIQQEAIPLLQEGRDLLGIAQTGTGKTAAFALPTLSSLAKRRERPSARRARVLVLAPTRELASQIAKSFEDFSRNMQCSVRAVFGGVPINKQIHGLKKGCDILVATPGRLGDLLGRGAIHLDEVEVLILDEADQMMDMGFIHDLRKIVEEVPTERQTMLFSATMPKSVSTIAKSFLQNPARVSVTPQASTAERVEQRVLHIAPENKQIALQSILDNPDIERVLIFTRTKHGADKLARNLANADIRTGAIHGNKSQNQRARALEAFRRGRCRILIATDIAARGIDVKGISHVINYEMPMTAEQYVHRIGRTARAGAEGIAISLVAKDERYYLQQVEKTTRCAIDLLDPPENCDGLILSTPDPRGPHRQTKRPRSRPKSSRPKQQRSKPSPARRPPTRRGKCAARPKVRQTAKTKGKIRV